MAGGVIECAFREREHPGYGAFVGKDVILGVRPEDVELTQGQAAPALGENVFRAVVDIVEPMGAETNFYLQTGNHTVVCRSQAVVDHRENRPPPAISLPQHPGPPLRPRIHRAYFLSGGPRPVSPASLMSDPLDSTPTRPSPPRARGGPLGWILVYTRGLVFDQHLRRLTMFYVVIAAMVMVFVGDVFLGEWLDFRQHLARFTVYWLAVGWLTILAALLAVYDLLLLRVQHRLLRRELRERMLGRDLETGRPREAGRRG